jgi:tetratricopeptide (TPR) repeat protein
MKRSTCLFVIAMTIATLSRSQDEKTVTAFSSSYLGESNKEYLAAIISLENVYDANSYALNLRLGWLNYLKKDYAKSQSYYKKAMVLEPKSIEARFGYVNPTAALQNWDDVLATYKDILAIDANNTVVNYRVGYIYYYRKNYDEALKYVSKVIALYPFDYDSNALMGAIYLGQGKIMEAKKYYKLALAYNPQSKEIQEVLKKL